MKEERGERRDGTRFTFHASRHASLVTFALLTILLLAFALRMARVGELRMWGDEAYSVYSAQRTLAAITFEGIENDPHPPLYYYLLHFYLPLAGASELALRFFSIFPGVATIALLYVIAKRMFGVRVGMMAAAFGAIAPFAVYYSQEIRMYALAMFLTTLALYFFARLLQGDDSVSLRGAVFATKQSQPQRGLLRFARHDSEHKPLAMTTRALWRVYALAMFLALYTLYHTAFVFLAEGIFLLALFKTRRAFVLRWCAVAVGIAALFLPWLLLRFSSTLGHLEERAGPAAAQSLPLFIARGFAALTLGTTIPPTNALALAAFFLALIIVGLFFAIKTRAAKGGDELVLALVVVPIVAVYPLYLLVPILVGRLFALAFAPLALLGARSVARLDRRMAIPIAFAIVALSAYSLGDYYFRFDRYNAAAEDYLPALRAVEQRAQPGDVVLFHAYWQQGYFLSHYRGAPLEYRALDNPNDLEAAVARPRNVWAIVQELPLHGSEVWLAQHAFPVSEQRFGQMRLISYRADTPARGESFSTPVVFNNGIALLGYRMNDAPLESGRSIATIQLDWQAARKIADDFTVSVRLSSPRGEAIWAQEDSQPASGTRPTSSWQAGQVVSDRHAFVIPTGTPPGSYAIQVVMYQPLSGRAVNIIAPENLRSQTLTLGNIAMVKPAIALPPPAIPNVLEAQWNEIALIGFAGGADDIAPGDTLPLTLSWQARRKATSDYLAVIQIVDAAGKAYPPTVYRPANEMFPTRAWEASETWLDKIRLNIAADAAPGDAIVLVGLIEEKTGEVITPHVGAPMRDLQIAKTRGRAVQLTRVNVTGRAHRFDLPSPQYPLQVNLDNQIGLLGYDLNSNTYLPGTTIRLTLYWQALDQMGERYAVFTHVIDPAGDLIAQRDSEPDAGSAPTTSWLRGEVIADRYQIDLPNALAPGDYTIQVGMYQAASGKRLRVSNTNSDRVLLTEIRVAGR